MRWLCRCSLPPPGSAFSSCPITVICQGHTGPARSQGKGQLGLVCRLRLVECLSTRLGDCHGHSFRKCALQITSIQWISEKSLNESHLMNYTRQLKCNTHLLYYPVLNCDNIRRIYLHSIHDEPRFRDLSQKWEARFGAKNYNGDYSLVSQKFRIYIKRGLRYMTPILTPY